MTSDTASPYARYRPWRRLFECGFWVVNSLIGAVLNSITMVMDVHRAGLGFADWEPVIWEWSSALAWLALVWPVVWFSRRFPLHWDTWSRQWPRYLLASVVVSWLHVLGMVGLRMLAYRWQGGQYAFGDWAREWTYEYLKDVRSFASMLVLIGGYRLWLLRLQGEARLLDPPEAGAASDSPERPQRLLVRKLGREFLIATADIEWAQAAGNYVNLHLRGHDYPLRSTMAAIEARLDPALFVRIHRSYLVNLGQVQSIEPLDGGEARVHLRDGGALPCSRRYLAPLRAASG
jgi:hypothetical protein